MAEQRDRPHGNSNFVVEFGSGASRSGRTGFAEVDLPRRSRSPSDRRRAAPRPRHRPRRRSERRPQRLLLRRGATGALDLYAWWDQARRGKAPARRVMNVKLLAEDHATVVMDLALPQCPAGEPLVLAAARRRRRRPDGDDRARVRRRRDGLGAAGATASPSRARRRARPARSAQRRGRSTRTVVPLPGSVSISTVALSRSHRRLTIARPSPSPCDWCIGRASRRSGTTGVGASPGRRAQGS